MSGTVIMWILATVVAIVNRGVLLFNFKKQIDAESYLIVKQVLEEFYHHEFKLYKLTSQTTPMMMMMKVDYWHGSTLSRNHTLFKHIRQ